MIVVGSVFKRIGATKARTVPEGRQEVVLRHKQIGIGGARHFFLDVESGKACNSCRAETLTNPLIPRSQRHGSHGEETMKIRSLLALVGLAICFALPAFAQQANAPDPQLRQQILPLSVIGRWSQTFKGHNFDPIHLDGHEVGVWKKRMLTGLNWLRLRPIWSLPSKFHEFLVSGRGNAAARPSSSAAF